jgi:hypothetical protein
VCVCQIKLAGVVDTVEQELPAVTLYILMFKLAVSEAISGINWTSGVID